MPNWWPKAHFGTADAPLPEVVAEDDDFDPDDEEIETPPDVIMMLGFDPAKEPGFGGVATEKLKPDQDGV